MTPAERVREALLELDALPAQAELGARGVWAERRIEAIRTHLEAALADLLLARPWCLTEGQELAARCDALGLTAHPWHSSGRTCPGDLRREFDNVAKRAAELRRMLNEGRWLP